MPVVKTLGFSILSLSISITFCALIRPRFTPHLYFLPFPYLINMVSCGVPTKDG